MPGPIPKPRLTVALGSVPIRECEVSADARDFQLFVVRYVGHKPDGKFMNLAICMSEISNGGSRFLACECTDEWEKLEALFPNADIDFLKDWCEAVQRDFCAPDTNRLV